MPVSSTCVCQASNDCRILWSYCFVTTASARRENTQGHSSGLKYRGLCVPGIRKTVNVVLHFLRMSVLVRYCSSTGRMPSFHDGRMPSLHDGRMPSLHDGCMPSLHDGRMPSFHDGAYSSCTVYTSICAHGCRQRGQYSAILPTFPR